jgi:hypothetical protein
VCLRRTRCMGVNLPMSQTRVLGTFIFQNSVNMCTCVGVHILCMTCFRKSVLLVKMYPTKLESSIPTM